MKIVILTNAEWDAGGVSVLAEAAASEADEDLVEEGGVSFTKLPHTLQGMRHFLTPTAESPQFVKYSKHPITY